MPASGLSLAAEGEGFINAFCGYAREPVNIAGNIRPPDM
jgi:hypothetical protein